MWRCGFHAGDPDVMARTVDLAKEHGVALGAHPGFPDLQGFGRRNMQMTSQEELAHIILYQIGALDAFVWVAGKKLQHVKPHGALYNQAAQDPEFAMVIAKTILNYNPRADPDRTGRFRINAGGKGDRLGCGL